MRTRFSVHTRPLRRAFPRTRMRKDVQNRHRQKLIGAAHPLSVQPILHSGSPFRVSTAPEPTSKRKPQSKPLRAICGNFRNFRPIILAAVTTAWPPSSYPHTKLVFLAVLASLERPPCAISEHLFEASKYSTLDQSTFRSRARAQTSPRMMR